MKVLFAVSNDNVSSSIIKKYQEKYKEIITSKNVYYFNAIIKELQKDKTYDAVVIGEDLEPISNNNYDTIDKFIFDKLDNISDEAYKATGEDIPIILICSDRRTKSDELLIKLFGIGIYNALLGNDRNIDMVCSLINKPRSKKEAKSYYKIDSEDVNYKPENEHEVPIWSYNYGKGSVNVIINNVKPNTTYKITSHYFNETGVKMSTGVLDVDGDYSQDYPWKLASDIKTNSQKSTEWQTNVHTITTGPRTNQIYAFAYTEWTGNESGAGVFYFDDVQIEEAGTVEKEVQTIDYDTKMSAFPNTIPPVQNFEQTTGIFKLTKKNQLFSTDEFSKNKTEYLAESMKAKGIIEDYRINVINSLDEAKGITLFKQPVTFELNELVNDRECEKDAYQIDINENSVNLYSDYIEGIQNGSMTLLQAFVQRDSLNCGVVSDYTDQNIRGLQVDSGRRYYIY